MYFRRFLIIILFIIRFLGGFSCNLDNNKLHLNKKWLIWRNLISVTLISSFILYFPVLVIHYPSNVTFKWYHAVNNSIYLIIFHVYIFNHHLRLRRMRKIVRKLIALDVKLSFNLFYFPFILILTETLNQICSLSSGLMANYELFLYIYDHIYLTFEFVLTIYVSEMLNPILKASPDCLLKDYKEYSCLIRQFNKNTSSLFSLIKWQSSLRMLDTFLYFIRLVGLFEMSFDYSVFSGFDLIIISFLPDLPNFKVRIKFFYFVSIIIIN